MSDDDEAQRLWAECKDADARGDYETALARITRLIETYHPDSHAFWMVRGNVERDMGDPVAARISYERAVALDPGRGRGHAWIGCLDEEEGRYESAILRFRHALSIEEDALARIWLAFALRKIGEFSEAKEHLERSIEVDPTNVDAYSGLADMLRLEDPRRALRIIERGIREDPEDPQARAVRGWILADLERQHPEC